MRIAFGIVVALCACGKPDKGDKAEQVGKVETTSSAGQADYAAKLIARLQQPGKPPLRYDAAKTEITDGNLKIQTGNLYMEYVALPPEERDAALAKVASTMSDWSDPKELSSADARLHMRPVVRAGMYFDLEVQAGKLADSSGRAMSEPIGAATGIGIGIDSADSIMVATDKQLASWKMSFDEAKAVALQNLRALDLKFEKVAPGVWSSSQHDNYDSSRLLLVDEITRLGMAPPVVALIPNRDTLLLASGKDAKGLLAMADLAEKAIEEPRPIHTVPLCLANKRWTECAPDVTPKVKARYQSMTALAWQSLYAEQHDSLQTLVGDEVFVAKLTAIQEKDGDRVATYATWTRTVPTLLPRAQFIAFIDLDADEKAKMIGLVPWDKAMAMAGERVQRDRRSPPRWATSTYFPTTAELAKLTPVKDPFE
ncbi:hypothetical protein BH11MYX3_BH11MYX3_12950 [soil metagenome]